MSTTHKLPPGYAMTVSAGDAAAVQVRQVQDATIGALIKPLRSKSFGPYLVERDFAVSGDATVAIDASASVLSSLLMSGASAPVDAARASLAVNPAGDDNGLIFTAVEYGEIGNRISIAYLDPSANDAALSVSVAQFAILVSLATDSEGAIVSTAAEVLAAIEASAPAAALVSVALDEDDDNFSDGSGVVTAMAVDLLEGGEGTGIGSALPGCVYIRTATPAVYTNTGTQAAPAWTTLIGSAAFGSLSSTVNALAALHLYGAGAPVDYTDGDPPATGEGTAPKGALYSDTTNGTVYRNSGSQAEPAWTQLGDAA